MSKMTTYIITYDLSQKEPEDYKALNEAIKGFGSRCKIQDSVWLIASEQSASKIFDLLHRHLGKGDKLFVSKVTRAAKWTSGGEVMSDWIHKYI